MAPSMYLSLRTGCEIHLLHYDSFSDLPSNSLSDVVCGPTVGISIGVEEVWVHVDFPLLAKEIGKLLFEGFTVVLEFISY